MSARWVPILSPAAAWIFCLTWTVADTAPAQEPERLRVEVVAAYPHDRTAYTQGLLWHDGLLYESTGQYGESSLRRVDLQTGDIEALVALAPDLFGEGLARVGERLIQLTWQAGEALVWDLESLAERGRFRYEGEGWGLCFDGRNLLMSDGSNRLVVRDAETFEVVRQVRVTLGDGSIGRLNELECAGGWVYANVYTTDWIVRIDPMTGGVVALIDAGGLLNAEESKGVDVLNGIAWDEERQLFYLTGKLWPKLFAVRFVAAGPS